MGPALSANVLAKSGKAVELAGDIDPCCWIRPAPSPWGIVRRTEYHPLPGVTKEQLAEAAMCASFGDQTPRASPLVRLGEEILGAGEPEEARRQAHPVYRPKHD
jgi:K+-transporting ATPase ATPase B chain